MEMMIAVAWGATLVAFLVQSWRLWSAREDLDRVERLKGTGISYERE